MSSPTQNFHSDGTLFIVSGPSGAGKTTLIERTRQGLADIGIELYFSVSHTTRVPRSGEREGINYHYVHADEFERMVADGEFLEWAHVHGNMYGTSRGEVQARLERGEDVILDIDVQGAQQISENKLFKPRSLLVFVFPPSFEELEARIRGRAMNTEGEIEIRLRKAFAEIEEGYTFYDYVIINDNLEVACECLKAAIIARKLKSKTALLTLREMARKFKEEHSGTLTRRH